MRLVVSLFALSILLYVLIARVPEWTASFEERHRTALLKETIKHPVSANIPDCPSTGPELDRFLETQQAEIAQPRLWKPVCQVVEPPLGKVIVVTTKRDELAACRESHPWTPANVRCKLDEPLRYLAQPGQPRTWARQQVTGQANQSIIWVTSRSLAWQEQLALEHQIRFCLILFFSVFATVAIWLTWRWKTALRLRAAGHEEDAPHPPKMAELFLHWMVGKRGIALAGDLNQEYALNLENGWPKERADHWYRWQVLHSFWPLLTRRFGHLIERGGPWKI